MRQCRQSPTANRRSLVWFFIIAGFAFVLRLIHLLQLRHNDPLFFSPQMDAQYHHEWALAIVAGKQFIADAFFRAPLYPYFLGFIYKLTGANQMVARVVQALIGSAGCGLVYLLARQLLQPQASSHKPQACWTSAGGRCWSCGPARMTCVVCGPACTSYEKRKHRLSPRWC
jgi:predicted membrane-bound mannosyltransferase